MSALCSAQHAWLEATVQNCRLRQHGRAHAPSPLLSKGADTTAFARLVWRGHHGTASTACFRSSAQPSGVAAAPSAAPRRAAVSSRTVPTSNETVCRMQLNGSTACMQHSVLCLSGVAQLYLQELEKLLKLVPFRFLDVLEQRSDLQEVRGSPHPYLLYSRI